MSRRTILRSGVVLFYPPLSVGPLQLWERTRRQIELISRSHRLSLFHCSFSALIKICGLRSRAAQWNRCPPSACLNLFIFEKVCAHRFPTRVGRRKRRMWWRIGSIYLDLVISRERLIVQWRGNLQLASSALLLFCGHSMGLFRIQLELLQRTGFFSHLTKKVKIQSFNNRQ